MDNQSYGDINDDDVGECAAPGEKSVEECAGTISNCWSPGQRDTGEGR